MINKRLKVRLNHVRILKLYYIANSITMGLDGLNRNVLVLPTD